ncbi:MAG: hypothetical protein WC261_13245 [Synergistaceae bacterium]|jgi:hypothetical protein
MTEQCLEGVFLRWRKKVCGQCGCELYDTNWYRGHGKRSHFYICKSCLSEYRLKHPETKREKKIKEERELIEQGNVYLEWRGFIRHLKREEKLRESKREKHPETKREKKIKEERELIEQGNVYLEWRGFIKHLKQEEKQAPDYKQKKLRELEEKLREAKRKKLREAARERYENHQEKLREAKRKKLWELEEKYFGKEYQELRNSNVCVILKKHAEELKDDPDRLPTDFIKTLAGLKKEDCSEETS